MTQTVTFNRDLFKQLVTAREEAIRERRETFELHGAKYTVGYAKHMIDYLRPAFDQPEQPRQPYNEGEEGQ